MCCYPELKQPVVAHASSQSGRIRALQRAGCLDDEAENSLTFITHCPHPGKDAQLASCEASETWQYRNVSVCRV
jgi:hypothetical protein